MESFAVRRGTRRGASQLDAALAELGMLATVTDARREYIQEALAARENSKDHSMQQLHHGGVAASQLHSHAAIEQDNGQWDPPDQEKMLRRLIRDEKRRLLKGQGHLVPEQQQHVGQQQQHR